MVVAIHARGGLWGNWDSLEENSKSIGVAIFYALTRAGTEWVLVFFVLSGFLVGGKLIERLGNNTFNLRGYAIDRITRIWVPLLPALIWSAWVAFMAEKSLSWTELFGSLAGVQGLFTRAFAENYPLWSLAYEVWFYFLGGWVALWLTTDSRKRVLAGLGVAIGLSFFTKLDVTFLFAWVIGASTYWLYHEPKSTRLALLGGGMMVGGYVFSQMRSATVSLDLSVWLQFVPSTSVAVMMLSLGIALLLPYLTRLTPRSGFVRRMNALGEKLAAFSYTLYLTHYPALYLWNKYMPELYYTIDLPSSCLYLLRIASCLLLGWLLYLPFEKQTSKVRKFIHSCWLVQRA